METSSLHCNSNCCLSIYLLTLLFAYTSASLCSDLKPRMYSFGRLGDDDECSTSRCTEPSKQTDFEHTLGRSLIQTIRRFIFKI